MGNDQEPEMLTKAEVEAYKGAMGLSTAEDVVLFSDEACDDSVEAISIRGPHPKGDGREMVVAYVTHAPGTYRHDIRDMALLLAAAPRLRQTCLELFDRAEADNATVEKLMEARYKILCAEKEAELAEAKAEVERLKANLTTACHYASLDQNMVIPGGATRDELRAENAAHGAELAALQAQVVRFKEAMRPFTDNRSPMLATIRSVHDDLFNDDGSAVEVAPDG